MHRSYLDSSKYYEAVSPSVDYRDGKWHVVRAVCTGEYIALFVDASRGSLVAVDTRYTPAAIAGPAGAATIVGRDPTAASFVGTVQDLRFMNLGAW